MRPDSNICSVYAFLEFEVAFTRVGAIMFVRLSFSWNLKGSSRVDTIVLLIHLLLEIKTGSSRIDTISSLGQRPLELMRGLTRIDTIIWFDLSSFELVMGTTHADFIIF